MHVQDVETYDRKTEWHVHVHLLYIAIYPHFDMTKRTALIEARKRQKQESKTTTRFIDLGKDVLWLIRDKLDVRSRYYLSITCKKFYRYKLANFNNVVNSTLFGGSTCQRCSCKNHILYAYMTRLRTYRLCLDCFRDVFVTFPMIRNLDGSVKGLNIRRSTFSLFELRENTFDVIGHVKKNDSFAAHIFLLKDVCYENDITLKEGRSRFTIVDDYGTGADAFIRDREWKRYNNK